MWPIIGGAVAGVVALAAIVFVLVRPLKKKDSEE